MSGVLVQGFLGRVRWSVVSYRVWCLARRSPCGQRASHAPRTLPSTTVASPISVELLVAPAVRVEDLLVQPDPKTGGIGVQANLRNARITPAKGWIGLTVSSAISG